MVIPAHHFGLQIFRSCLLSDRLSGKSIPLVTISHLKELAQQSYRQMWVAEAQAVVVICAVYGRVTAKNGQRGVRYAHIEAGCVAQNISLEGINLGLGSTVVGAFSDSGVAEIIKADEDEVPLIVMPVGLKTGPRGRADSMQDQNLYASSRKGWR